MINIIYAIFVIGSFVGTIGSLIALPFAFIKKKNCLITGNAWEERLIDEVGSSEKDDQVTRIRIPVRFEA